MSEEIIVADEGTMQHIVINQDRSVAVPSILKKSIVQHDHNIERLTFDCPRYWYGKDISALNIYANYISVSQKSKGEDPGSSLCENVVIDENDQNILHFDWVITDNVSEYMGGLIFLVCAKSVDSDGNEDVHWNSHLCKELEVQEGLEASGAIVKRYPDVIESILSKLGKQIELRNSGTAIQYRNAGENTWVDLVQLEDIKGDAAVIIESNFKGSDTTANILAKTGETGDKWYSTDDGVYYMFSSKGEWINCGSGENLKKIEDEISKLHERVDQLEQSGVGTGLSTEAIDKLEEVGNYLAYTTADGGSKWTELISILRNGSSGGGSGETEVTLSSISATYTGGDVTTGTALSDLTGITVTATYSDGSTENVTGYTLSGEILEGENTITVSYGGLITTFEVIGVAGENSDYNNWTSGIAYDLNLTADKYWLTSGGKISSSPYANWSASDYLPCHGAKKITVEGTTRNSSYNYFVAEDKETMVDTFTTASLTTTTKDVPDGAYWVVLSNTTESMSFETVTPYDE